MSKRPRIAAAAGAGADEPTAVAGKVGKPAPSLHAGPSAFTPSEFLPAASMTAFTSSLKNLKAGDACSCVAAGAGPPASGPLGAAEKLLSWNCNGIRAALQPAKKSDVLAWLSAEDPSILCLQETRIDASLTAGFANAFPGLPHAYFCCSSKKGYAGVALYSRAPPLSVVSGLGDAEHDSEGRCITAEFERFYVVNVYVPNSGRALDRLPYRTGAWDPALRAHVAALQLRKPVVLIGDLNVCHLDMDIHAPKNRNKVAGFCDGERDGFAALQSAGLHDVWRLAHPTKQQFTYWGAMHRSRENNRGWRLDYVLVSATLLPRVVESFVRHSWPGTDHVPIGFSIAA